MNKKNLCIDLDTQLMHYEPPMDDIMNITNALSIVNELMAKAIAFVGLNDLGGAATCINKVWTWLGEGDASISSAAEAYTEITKIYRQIEDTGLIGLPTVCPFVIH